MRCGLIHVYPTPFHSLLHHHLSKKGVLGEGGVKEARMSFHGCRGVDEPYALDLEKS